MKKGDKLTAGKKIVIPDVKKWVLQTNNSSVLDKKISWFDNQINDIHMKLFDPTLNSAEREKLEAQYIKLMNMRKDRKRVAAVTKAGNGINLVLDIKERISVAEFRKLFPECTTNFRDYAYKTNQAYCDPKRGWVADPEGVFLEKGAHFIINEKEFARDDGDGFWRGVGKTLGLIRLDGK